MVGSGGSDPTLYCDNAGCRADLGSSSNGTWITCVNNAACRARLHDSSNMNVQCDASTCDVRIAASAGGADILQCFNGSACLLVLATTIADVTCNSSTCDVAVAADAIVSMSCENTASCSMVCEATGGHMNCAVDAGDCNLQGPAGQVPCAPGNGCDC
ncbi:MAG: hypothetical protein HYS27_20345 [Deltaproteobacteria bacterium]|nr:hypothetical protein [Deltaproteobacteria bacterium]